MKRNLLLFCFIFFLFPGLRSGYAQLSFNNGLTATQLAQLLAGNGVSVSNATFNCAATGIGSFSGTSSIGFSNGVILSSGDISLASPNSNTSSAGNCNSTPGESDLNSLAGASTYDACALEFDVIPLCDTLKFKYVFGSDEYPEFVNSGYNDAFAFFISGPGISGQPNIAQLPNSSTYVTIDNVNNGANSQYYVANSGTTIEYDGHTTVLTAWSLVQSCQTYHLRIVIADAGDCVYDSGVFLEAGSLQCASVVAATATVQNAVEGCQDGSFEFCRPAATNTSTTINYTIAGSAINGTDYNTIGTSVTIPAGQTCASLTVVPVDDGVNEPADSILIIYQPGPCPVMDTVTIYLTDNVLNAGPDKTICSGNDTTIGPAPVTGATYSWTPTTSLSSATVSNPVVTGTNSGNTPVSTNYILTATIGTCSSSDSVIVTVDPLATAAAGPDQTICGGTIQLAGTITGASGGTWSGGTGTYTPNDSALNATYTPTTAEINSGTVILTLSANGQSGSCASSTDDVEITISVTASVSAGPDQTICVGNPAVLSGSFGGTATSGLWLGGSGTFVPDNTSPTAVYTPSTAEMTAGSVTLIYSAGDPNSTCPPVTDQVLITIDQQPTANAGSAQSACVGKSITLSGTIGGTATSGTWSGGTGTYNPDNTTLNAVYTPSAAEYAAGSVTLTLTTDDPSGPCTFSSSNVTLSFYETPVVDFNAGATAGCPVHCTDFTDASTIGSSASIVSWDWNFGDNGEGSTLQNPSNCFLTSGSYDVELTVTSSDGCIATLTKTQLVEVYSLPVAEFSSSPDPATIIEPYILFSNESSSDVNSWHWYFGDGDTLAPSTPNPGHEYMSDSAHTYTATLIVTNVNGCSDTVEHDVIIGPAFTFYIPNAFTPNGDGKNDFFFGSGIGIGKFEMRIFDRWGNMVFKTTDINEPWDGKANDGSKPAQLDVYVWKVSITDVLNKKHHYVGTVTISSSR